jgi:4'-phosphopantetheinyl transferase EntD
MWGVGRLPRCRRRAHREVIQQILPARAIGVSTNGGAATTALLPSEARFVAGTSRRRQQEFAAGRSCAREALTQLGWPGFAILVGPDREPKWPPGVIGSITHCPGYCAAAVAPSGELVGLGIDAEPNVAVDADLRLRVAHSDELAGVGRTAGVDAAVLIFSAKESAFKAWYPLTHHWLDLLDVRVRVDLERRMFEVRLLAPAATPLLLDLLDKLVIRGRWAVTPTHVCTVTTIVGAEQTAVRAAAVP